MPNIEQNEQPNMAAYEQRIRERLVVDETTPSGLRWGQSALSQVRGKPAGKLDSRGYWQVGPSINGVQKWLLAHRIVWLLSNGRWPEGDIDHINGDKNDNRIANLRDASHGENMYNAAMPKNNSSGVKGVCLHKATGKWQAQIGHERRRIHLGLFINIDDAEKAIKIAREQLHGEFANHGVHCGVAQ